MPQPETITHRRNPFAREPSTASPSPAAVLGEATKVPVLRPAITLGEQLRELSGHEEELFEDRRLAGNSAALCNELLARCLVAPGRDPGPARARIASLTIAERDLALVALRRLSLGDRVETHVDCPACAEVNEVEFDLGLLPTTLPAIPERISGTLGDGTDAVLRLPTAGDQAELLAAGLDGAARRRSWLLARVLLEYGDAVAPFAADAVHELATARRRELEALLDAALPDFELGMEVCCPACGQSFTAPFGIDSFFLLS